MTWENATQPSSLNCWWKLTEVPNPLAIHVNDPANLRKMNFELKRKINKVINQA